MRKLILISCALVAFCFSNSVLSQTKNKKQELNKLEVLKAPLSEKEKSLIVEAYSLEYLNLVQKNKSLEIRFKDILRNRVRLTEVVYKEKLDLYPLLSSIGFYTEFNKNLDKDKAFNKENFNVLKYNFNFDSDINYAVRIDNTNFILRVDSQFKK
ncbi:hypothetical protein [Aurantibacter aestuarii]|uniref:Peptidylprolyl isomerase n=1 Tax=Aurantibacter aestuarii TaxID=1266046 RepID=A0A2T1NG65_9FLAO|nr:hypothetical protein [Aurantibacter aestuarii]PSG91769.1 hypothetical protein C7H52_01240 [Aurantibacter aestuarii]